MTTTTTTTTISAVPSTVETLMSSVFAVATVTVLGMLARNRLFTKRIAIKSNGPPSSATYATRSCSGCGVSPSPPSAEQASLESLISDPHSPTPEPTALTFRTSRHSVGSPTSCEEIPVGGHVSRRHREEEHQSSEAGHDKEGERDEDEGRVMANIIDTGML